MQHAPRIPVLEVDLGPGIRAFFTTRDGGVSTPPWATLNLGTAVGDDPAHVAQNRRLVEQVAGSPVTFATQVHGCAVVRAELAGLTGAPPGATPAPPPSAPASPEPALPVPALPVPASPVPAPSGVEADALVSLRGGGAIGVYVADCVPVLLADPVSGAVAAVHAGRPGVELGVVGQAVRALVASGAEVGRLRAAVGPSVCGLCYEVPDELRERVAAAVPSSWATTSWGTPALDLPRAVGAQLAAAGVRAVTRLEVCTRTDHRFFSHRRASAQGLVTGRFAGVVRPPALP